MHPDDDDLTPWQRAARELEQAREAHERSLVVGARVRINLGECDLMLGAALVNGCIGHPPDAQGRTATVVSDRPFTLEVDWSQPMARIDLRPGCTREHRYCVRYDAPVPPYGSDHGNYAADELEILDREPPLDSLAYRRSCERE